MEDMPRALADMHHDKTDNSEWWHVGHADVVELLEVDSRMGESMFTNHQSSSATATKVSGEADRSIAK